jgi:hypothetical protein
MRDRPGDLAAVRREYLQPEHTTPLWTFLCTVEEFLGLLGDRGHSDCTNITSPYTSIRREV